MTYKKYYTMSIDERINYNYHVKVLIAYLRTAHTDKPCYTRTVPSNLRYGGHRNTCYDLRID